MARADLQITADEFLKAINSSNFDQVAALLADTVEFYVGGQDFGNIASAVCVGLLRQIKGSAPTIVISVDKWMIDVDESAVSGQASWASIDQPENILLTGAILLRLSPQNVIISIFDVHIPIGPFWCDCAIPIPTAGSPNK